jgi:type II secretory pathway pseudopilin PulG
VALAVLEGLITAGRLAAFIVPLGGAGAALARGARGRLRRRGRVAAAAAHGPAGAPLGPGAGSALARRRQAGLTLVELLVTTSILMVVIGALLATFESSQRIVPNDVEWSHALQEGNAGLLRMVREIRQAAAIIGTTPNAVDFRVTLGGQDQHVLYQCDVVQAGTPYRECMRVQAAVGAALPLAASGQPVIARLLNGTVADPVFSYTPNAIAPTFISVTVKLPAAGERSSAPGTAHAIVLADGAYLRNQDLGG